MKKLLVLGMVLVSFVSYGQVDLSTLNDTEKMILKTFKDTYVEKTFKDPYSFKLLKFEVTSKTFGDWVMDDINFIKKQIEQKDFKFQTENQLIEDMNKHQKSYSEMSSEIKNKIKGYKVNLDCYGNNSYGNPILSRYKFNYVVYSKDMRLIDYYNTDKLYVSVIK